MHTPSNPTFPGVKVEVGGSHSQRELLWWGWLICGNYGLSSTAEWTTSFQLMSSSAGQSGPHLWQRPAQWELISPTRENNRAVLGPGFWDALAIRIKQLGEESYGEKWCRFACSRVQRAGGSYLFIFFSYTLFILSRGFGNVGQV